MSDYKGYAFFAMLDRMQYIQRWSLMRNSKAENNKEHSYDVAVIAHALAVLHNKMKSDEDIFVSPEKVQSYAIYHDCTEIITGDLPTPVKYKNKELTKAFKQLESDAAKTLTDLLPEDMRDIYSELLSPEYSDEEGELIKTLVKAADRISAYIKCMREENSSNKEFSSAKKTISDSIETYSLPEIKYFMENFIPAFGLTLDQLSGGDN